MPVAQGADVENQTIDSRPAPFDRPQQGAIQPAEAMMVLVAGANARLVEWAALSLFRAGHIPVVGQWFWPLVSSDDVPGDAGCDESLEPVAQRLLARCDAVLCVDDRAADGDAMIGRARARGLRVFFSLEDALAG